MKWVVKAACAGIGAVLLLGCGETEQEPLVALQPPGGAAGAGAGPVGAGAGGSAAGGPSIPPEMPCAADMNPQPAPPGPIAGELTAVVPSNGCGREPLCPAGMKRTLQTTGTKASDCADVSSSGKHVCGAWSVPRDFWVYLPANYDSNKPYPLVIEGPGCGGNGGGVYSLSNVKDQVIRVGVSPGPASTGHATNPGQACFDDREGDDSIDWEFYERLYDRLSDELCFDRQRVFVSGDSSGGALANELGCKYAGDPVRPVRAVLANSAPFPAEPQALPTCSQAPIAGMWVHETKDTEVPFEGAKRAVSRAMNLSHCPGGDYDHAQFQNFPIGGGEPDETCQLIVGCDELYPLVMCALPFITQAPNNAVVEPGWAKFIQLFSMGDFISRP